MIAKATGARVAAIDISDKALALAKACGAEATINANKVTNVPEAIAQISGSGAHVSLDALGSKVTCINSILGLRTRGRHVQIGLMAGADTDPAIPMGRVIAKELELIGSHGMQAHLYGAMFEMIKSGVLQPHQLIGREISLAEAGKALTSMDKFQTTGVTVITSF